MLIMIMRDTAVLGNMQAFFTLPTFEMLRMVTLGATLSRMEILFAVVLIMMLFAKILILFYVSVIALAQLLRLKTYHPVVLVTGVLIIAYATFVFRSFVQHAAWAREIAPALWTFLEIMLPLLTLVVAKIRKVGLSKAQRKEGQASVAYSLRAYHHCVDRSETFV